MLKLADNFAAFNQRLKYAHYRPLVPLKSDPRAWWKYAYRAVSDQLKKGGYFNFSILSFFLSFFVYIFLQTTLIHVKNVSIERITTSMFFITLHLRIS